MWSKGSRALRDTLVPLGWTVRRARNLERTVHPENRIAIVIAQGTDATGRDSPVRTRYKRGPVMREAIEGCQLNFSLISPEEFPPTDEEAVPDLWVLLYYIDRLAEEIRIEFSLPDGMDAEGYLTSWSERIFLDPIPIASAQQAGRFDEGDEGPYEVAVYVRPK